jgi:hypothetical protein
VFLSGLALLVERSGVLDVIPLMTHPYVVVFFDYVGNLLYVIPVVFLFLIWLSRYLIARSYVKVQKSD